MASSDIDLTTVAAVSAYLGGDNTASADLIQSLITAASAFAQQYCSRDFRLLERTERYNGLGTQRIVLRVAPVASVSSLTIDGTSITARATDLGYGFVFDDTGTIYVSGCWYFTRGWQNVAVTYIAGWLTPGQAAATSPPGTVTLPMDIQQAVIEMVALKFKAQRNNIGIAARQIAGETISYTQADIPKSAQPVFDFYSRVGVWS